MKKILPLLIITALLASCNPTSPTAPAPSNGDLPPTNMPLPVVETIPPTLTENPVQLAWFYKPPEDGTALSVLATSFDTFVLTHYDEEERDQLKGLGVESPFLEYLLFVEIQDPGSCEKEPYGNQAAYKSGDFCELVEQHPDWFLRDSRGELIRDGRNVYMDPGNEGYRAFWLERAQELQEFYGWDGIFIDNIEGSLNKFRRLEQMPVQYSTDEQYQQEVEAFLGYVAANYFIPEQRPMYGNIVEYNDTASWMRYLAYLDGVMIEDFAVGYNDRYYSERHWLEQIEMVRTAQASEKALILVAQGEMQDTDRARFAFISYLLVADGVSAFRYTGSGYYEDVWLYENYFLPFGATSSDLYEWNSGWRRDFVNGYVFINPESKYSEINITE